jgi:hypothetical protein
VVSGVFELVELFAGLEENGRPSDDAHTSKSMYGAPGWLVRPVGVALGWAKTKYRDLSTAAAKCAAFGRDDVCFGCVGGEQTTAAAWPLFALVLIEVGFD